MSSYFTRLAARLAAPGSTGRQGQGQAFTLAPKASLPIETQFAGTLPDTPQGSADGPEQGSTWGLAPAAPTHDAGSNGAALPGFDSVSQTQAHAARQTTTPAPLVRAVGPEVQEYQPSASLNRPPPNAVTFSPPTPPWNGPTSDTSTTVAAEASAGVRSERPGSPLETHALKAQPSAAAGGIQERPAAHLFDQDAAKDQQAEPVEDATPQTQRAEAANPPAGWRRPAATQPATGPRAERAEPRSRRKPATPRIDVHIGTVTLTVRAPSAPPPPPPSPAPAPPVAPRAEPGPAFSASRHYLRLP
jgi:hypothetical protein